MIQYPFLAVLSLTFFVLTIYLEIRYYRAGSPRTKKWLITLFLCGAGAAISFGLSIIATPIIMFQHMSTCGVMVFAFLGGGIVAVYTVPMSMREAEKHRERLRGR
ncbi:MAG: hypothetical protein R2867_12525 [Caldilineaceae bacterium]|nr:hypothetical protein [Candidatus Saccharibacteria bacterium]